MATRVFLSDARQMEWLGMERCTRHADQEARRILAVTEQTDPQAGIYGETVSLATLNAGLRCTRGVPGARWSIRTEEAQILAEALETFLSKDGE